MPPEISDIQSEILHEQIVPALYAMLDDASPLEDPDVVEQLAATLLVAMEQPEMPVEGALAILDGIEARRDVDAAGVLAALAVLAGEPLAAHARASVERLAEEGIVTPAGAGVGMLAVEKAVRMEGSGADLLVALLRRPGAREVQAAILGIEHRETAGALVECGLTPPAPEAELRELLAGVDGAAAPEPLSPEELVARVVAAAGRAVELGIALGPEAGSALPVISRALTGVPTGLPRPTVLAPWEDDDEELIVDVAADEEGFDRVMEMLLSELEEHVRATHPPDGVVWQYGDFVASTMLQWKGGYDDGRLGRWTEDDLAEYLLDYFPRKVSVDAETLDAVPECALAFLEFLDARGSLSGQPLEQLEQACEALRDEFHECVRDSSQWGLAKSMVMQMQAEGIDPGAPGAFDAWMTDFNARPYQERDAVIGRAADRMAHAAGPRPSKRQRTQQRKAQRAARKRNRGR